LEAQRVRLRDQRIKIRKRAEQGIDVAIIADVVTVILHRRPEERRQPDRIDAKARDVIELFGDALEVAHAVAIAVAKRARIDLVENRAAPPITQGAEAWLSRFTNQAGKWISCRRRRWWGRWPPRPPRAGISPARAGPPEPAPAAHRPPPQPRAR